MKKNSICCVDLAWPIIFSIWTVCFYVFQPRRLLMKLMASFIFIMLLASTTSQAAEFCVTSSAGLQSALTSASTNNQHNTIKIAEGIYDTPGSTFEYSEGAGWDLEISGGWTEFFGNDCGQQLSGHPYNTVLDGNGTHRIMNIESGGNSDITISNLMFLNGGYSTLPSGGGLRFWSTNNMAHTGRVTIERNAFVNNQAEESSALYFFSSGPKSHFRNNIFTLNTSHDGSYTLDINYDLDSGVYFTNNTVINNAGDSVNNYGGVRFFTTANSTTYVGNNLLYDNGNRDLHFSGSGETYLNYNNVDLLSGTAPTHFTGNFSADPELIEGFLEFTPSFGSPLVNAGFDPPNFVPIPTPFDLAWFEGTHDVVGNVRKQQGRVDIGAVETGPEPPIFINGFE